MKTSVMILLLSILGTLFSLSAQNRLGLLGGVNLAGISESPVDHTIDYQQLSGLLLGTFNESSISQTASLRYEISYVEKGSNLSLTVTDYGYYGTDTYNIKGAYKLSYIEFASFLTVSPGRGDNRIYLLGGPRVSYLVSARVSGNISYYDESLDFGDDIASLINEFDFGFTFGGGIRLGNLFAEARYALALTDFSKDGSIEQRHKGLQILGGISIPVGR